MSIVNLSDLAKTSVDSYDYVQADNSLTLNTRKLNVASLFPSLATTGTSSESFWISITNKNQLNFKGIKSGDTDLLTVTTASNNIVLTALEAGIDLSLCNNTTSGFLSGMDFTGTVTGECPVSSGGTGLSTIAKGAMLYASANDVISATAVASNNADILVYNSTTGIPAWTAIDAGDNITLDRTVAGVLTLDASLSTLAANLVAVTHNINLDYATEESWISGDGSNEGIAVDAAGKVFMGQSTPTAFYQDTLNIIGGIRFANTSAPTLKPNDSGNGVVGANVTIQGGASTDSQAGHLYLNAGVGGSGAAGSVVVTAGQSSSGTDGNIQLKTATGGSAVAGLTVAAEGQNVTVDTGNLIITGAAKGIVHTGSGTVTQGTSGTPNYATGVTLNTTSGIITLDSAETLAAGAFEEFVVTNSTVQADSVILLQVQSLAEGSETTDSSLIAYTNTIAGGSFNILLQNGSDATLAAGARKIHFLVINNS
tara:strand:- start:1260 stop:2708 length:1449 start_codon:yes stop_codon:yes gene_type:complete